MRRWPRTLVLLALASCAYPTVHREVSAAPPPRPRPAPPPRSLPIQGGTLRISRDRTLAALSDPERDRVWLVDLATLEVRAEVALEPGDEPGRIAEDFGRRFHVALRGGGAIATIDEDGRVVKRRRACPAPRGIELDPSGDAIHVACAGGELSTFGIFDDVPARTLFLPPDLRDVVADEDRLYVSRFRSAEVLTLDRHGTVVATKRPPKWDMDRFLDVDVVDRPRRTYDPSVAWRIVKDPSGRIVMLHQRAAEFPIDMDVSDEPRQTTTYGGFVPSPLAACPPGISHAALSSIDPLDRTPIEPESVLDQFQLNGSRAFETAILGEGAIPVDLAISPDGQRMAMALPGRAFEQVVVTSAERSASACITDGELRQPGVIMPSAFDEPVAVAWIDDLHLAVQYRRPHALVIYGPRLTNEGRSVALGARPPRDEGEALFHQITSAGLACASCHPEGGDDGRVWNLGALGGLRRTPTLLGGVMTSAPFHWAGDLASLDALIDEVFVGRMGGGRPSASEVEALGAFLGALPPPARASVRDAGAVERGRARFVEAGCERCHAGPRRSDDRNHDVGTGEALQTPTLLGLAARPPYLHDGRAPTLRARFAEGHTEGHGDLSRLDDAARDDLVAYLASL